MPEFHITTLETWEHRVSYKVDADTLAEAYEQICGRQHAYTKQDVVESGDKVLFMQDAYSDEDGDLAIPPEFQEPPAQPALPQLNPRELATVLAALKYLVAADIDDCDDDEWTADVRDDAMGNGQWELMTGEEIHELCERLKGGSPAIDPLLTPEGLVESVMESRGATFADLLGEDDEHAGYACGENCDRQPGEPCPHERYHDVPCPDCHGQTENCGRCRGLGTVSELFVDE